MSGAFGRLLCRLGRHDSYATVTWAWCPTEVRCSRCGIIRRWSE